MINDVELKYNRSITIAIADSRFSTNWQNRETTWSHLVTMLSLNKVTKETAAEYRSLPKDKQDQIKDIGGFVGGKLKGCYRRNGEVEFRSIATLDFDDCQSNFLDILKASLQDMAYVVYSTHKHTPKYPRVRVCIPFSRDVTVEEYEAITRKLAYRIDINSADDTTYQAARLMYLPSSSKGAEIVYFYNDAPLINVDKLLSEYTDWRDCSQYPISDRETIRVRKDISKLKTEPSKKTGVIGAFCKAYPISNAIETFLSDKYEKGVTNDRYTYIGGSTSNGGVIYEDNNFFYSNHATDPASGRVCNAFDLVRIHKFGMLDDDIHGYDDPSKYPSFNAMINFAAKDPLVHKLLVSEAINVDDVNLSKNVSNIEDTDDIDIIEDDSIPEKTEDWHSQLTLSPKTKRIEDTVYNISLILENDPNLNKLGHYDTFFNELTVDPKNAPIWRNKQDEQNRVWTDSDDASLRAYLEKVYGIYSKQKTDDAVKEHFMSHQVNCVKDYIKSIQWDGKKRAEKLLIHFFNCDDNWTNRQMTKIFLTAAITRIFEPGCKFDYVLTMDGEQGIGKSEFVRKISHGWMTDNLSLSDPKTTGLGLEGVWFVEMAELAQLDKVSSNIVKNVVSQQFDKYRSPYDKHDEIHPRRCVFIANSNESTFLDDVTGDRRFWCIHCNKVSHTRWEELTDDYVAQMWGEVYQWYLKGEVDIYNIPLELSSTLKDRAADKQIGNPYAEVFEEFLELKVPYRYKNMTISQEAEYYLNEYDENTVSLVRRDKVSLSELWELALKGKPYSRQRQTNKNINNAMDTLPNWKKYTTTQRINGKVQKNVFYRVGSDEDPNSSKYDNVSDTEFDDLLGIKGDK